MNASFFNIILSGPKGIERKLALESFGLFVRPETLILSCNLIFAGTHPDVLDVLPGVVGDDHVGSELLAVIIDLLVQSDLQVELALREGEALADERARQTASAVGRSELDLLDGQGQGGTLVGLVVGVVTNVGLDAVLDTQRLAVVIVTGLQGDRARGVLGEVEGEWEGVGSQLLHEAVLDGRQLALLVDDGDDLLLEQDHLLAELNAHDLIFLPTISVGGRELQMIKIN